MHSDTFKKSRDTSNKHQDTPISIKILPLNIHKCLKNGETPEPGPLGGEDGEGLFIFK
jgi:hypothetical protein